MLSPEHRKALKIAAVGLFNVTTVWWLTKALNVNFRELIAGLEVAVLILAPLLALYLRSQWPTKRWLASAVLLPMLWFATYGFLHEMSHHIGVIVVGSKVLEQHWIPHFWRGEFTVGWIRSEFLPGWRGALPGYFPYLRDVVLLFAGLLILKLKKIRSAFLVGLVFILLCLSPLFDIVDNYFAGYVLGHHPVGNDFTGGALHVGAMWTNVIGILFSASAVYVVSRILVLYKDFAQLEPARLVR
jgi:hypothetical protein